MNAHQHLSALWTEARLPADALDDAHLTGSDPVLPSSFAVGTAAQVSVASASLAAATLWRYRGGERQTVSVDMRHAAVEFLSEHFASLEGVAPEDPWDPIAGAYQCGDGRWVRLHTNFPHHRDGILRILGCDYDRPAVARALASWTAFALEDAAAANGLCATAMRSFAEWDAHKQGQAVVTQPLVKITRLGDAPPQGLPRADRPLTGVRVLDLTRVIAGPVCGRQLAAHGADVLTIASPNLPNLPRLIVDTGRGKRSAYLDLHDPAGSRQLRDLLSHADIFVQGYRPGGLADRGFSPQDAARIRPGIVYVSLSAYGHVGPWSNRRGFDSLTQTASGLNHAEAEAAGQTAPKPLPCQALDHGSGYLLAFGALTALMRRMREGGSWHVQVSLARTGRWVRDLGRVKHGLNLPMPTAETVSDLMETTMSGSGRLRAVRHSAVLSETPARWNLPSVPLGTHPPAWA
jgi:crotonobetainyl-CoA:carnitine CoA-transferase CaiB-like acyl-CoA transferase